MTAYVLSNNATLRDIGNASIWGVATARTGGDTVDTNGFRLTIDQDSRYGLGGTTSTTWGSLTINASKGGEIHIDGTKVWMIPYTGGSGTLTLGAAVTIGSATGNTIGIYTSLTAAPTTTGATGWLKLTNVSGTLPSSGSFTQAGFTFTISAAPFRGFIEVNGDEASTIVANRLGTFRITGSWYALGTTSGVSNQTLQIPNNGTARYVAGVFIEKNAGAQDYEFYPNAGTATTIGTEAARGKVVWIDANGLVRIGNSGSATNGFTPAAGLAVVVPNVFLENNTTAARTANVIPNATVASRYDFTCTGGGVLEIDKCNSAWYLSAIQAYSVNVSDSGFVDAIMLSEIASAMTFSRVGVGNKPTTALLTNPLTMTYCFAGGIFTDCVWTRVSMATYGAYTNVLNDVDGFTFVRDTTRANTIRGNATTYAWNAIRANNCTWINPVIIQGALYLTTCANITITDTVYCEAVSGTTVTTYPGYVWVAHSVSTNVTISGLTLPVANNHPYTSLLWVGVASNRIKLRNIGTRVAPLNLGTTNGCGLVYQLATGAADIKIQRVYTSNTRTGIMSGDNSCNRVTEENVAGDYADAVDVVACLNMRRKGVGTTGALTSQVSVYGTHWYDVYTSTTAGRLVFMMNEPTSSSAPYVTLTNGANFTSAGSLYMPTIGMTALFETDYFILGHTGFANSAAVMAGGTVGNYRFEYSINKNDGNGWSTMTSSSYTAAALGTALNGITGISDAVGFKIRLQIKTTTTNTTAITSLYLITTTTATSQDNLYPLDLNTLTFTGLIAGTEVRVYSGTDPSTSVEIGGVESSGTSFTMSHSAGGVSGYAQFISDGQVPINLPLTFSSSDVSIPIQQRVDRNFNNP
jgi:hypothetical protein